MTRFITPTELGARAPQPLNGQAMNRALAEAGLQVRVDQEWRPTLEGMRWAQVETTPFTRTSVRWHPSVLSHLPGHLLVPETETKPRSRTQKTPAAPHWRPDGRPVILLDTETTGHNSNPSSPRCNCVHQVSLLVLNGWTLEEMGAWSSDVRPERPENADPAAMRVSGRTLADLRNAPTNQEALRAMEVFLLGANRALRTEPQVCEIARTRFVIAGHNTSYDRRFLNLMYQRIGFPPDRLGTTYVCTLAWARRLVKQGLLKTPDGSLTLDSLLKVLRLPPRTSHHHDAAEDVRATARLLRSLHTLEEAASPENLRSPGRTPPDARP